jgi:hypothetical protein
MGLSALALEDSPLFPTYPDRMSDADVSAGLVLPYAAVALLGKGGAIATLLIVFMAVTSATSSELIAVSSIFTYDFYRTYVKPDASGRRLIYISHVMVVCYALFISTFSVGLYYAGISMGYLYLMMGVIISAAVLPATLTLVWAGQNKWAASLSPIVGLALALIAWLVTAKHECGKLDVACTGSNNPMLAGNVVALLSPLILIPIFTLCFGVDHYDWQSMLAIRQADDHDATPASEDIEHQHDVPVPDEATFQTEQTKLARASRISKWTTVVMTVAFLVLWPFPMYGSSYIFSKPFFTGWVTVGIIWIFCSLGAVGLFPIFEGRHTLAHTFKLIVADLTGRGHRRGMPAEVIMATDAHGKSGSGGETPPVGTSEKEPVATH